MTNEDKFNYLYKKYRKEVNKVVKYHAFSKYSGDVDDGIVEDLSQDVWIKIWNAIERFEDPKDKRIKYYINTTAMFHVIKYFENHGNMIFKSGIRVPLDIILDKMESESYFNDERLLHDDKSDEKLDEYLYEQRIYPKLTPDQECILAMIRNGYKYVEIIKDMQLKQHEFNKNMIEIKRVIKENYMD